MAAGERDEQLRQHPRSTRSSWKSPTSTSSCVAWRLHRHAARHQPGHGCGRSAGRSTALGTRHDAGRFSGLTTPTSPTSPATSGTQSDDFNAYGQAHRRPGRRRASASGTLDDPRATGRSWPRRLLSDVIPYQVGTPATYGIASFNARTQADNAPEVRRSSGHQHRRAVRAEAVQIRASTRQHLPLGRASLTRRGPSPARCSPRRAASRYSSKVQQRPLTATSTSYSPHPASAGTADNAQRRR